VVEGARLERVYSRKVIQGSNPCLSASLDIYVIIVFMYRYRSAHEQFDFAEYMANHGWIPSDHEKPERLRDKITLVEALEVIRGMELWHAEEVTEAVSDLPKDNAYDSPHFEEFRQRANAINYLSDRAINGDQATIGNLSSEYREYQRGDYSTLLQERQAAVKVFHRIIDPYVSVAN
jgi:hypothetical protein